MLSTFKILLCLFRKLYQRAVGSEECHFSWGDRKARLYRLCVCQCCRRELGGSLWNDVWMWGVGRHFGSLMCVQLNCERCWATYVDVLLELMVFLGLHGDKILGTRITCFQAVVSICTCSAGSVPQCSLACDVQTCLLDQCRREKAAR